LRVWLDEWVLSPGDSLTDKIDDGVSNSQVGVVVLSHPFFAKEWPQIELDSLYTLAVSGRRSVIPVWHEITATDVMEYSPRIAELLALSTSRGIKKIAKEIAQKVGPIGSPLLVEVDTNSLSVALGVAELASAIRGSEDTPGSYAKRCITVSFSEEGILQEEEIRQGIRLLITQEPLTFPVRTSVELATCLDSFVHLYDNSSWEVTGTRLDLWLREDTSWSTGIYVTPEEESHICSIIGANTLLDLRGGFPNNMLDLGASILATKAIPRILFEFFRRQQRDGKDYTENAHKLLALPAWTFGIG